MHRTVLLHETCDWILPRMDGVVVDCTFGGGGHSRELLRRRPGLPLIAIDQDPGVVAAETSPHVVLRHGRFGDLEKLVPERPIVGIVADLGFSSLQMDDPTRGMSFQREGPLDMRLDPSRGEPLSTRLKALTVEELATILHEYGQERFARSMAREICAAAQRGELRTTSDLVRAALPGVPRGARHGRIHFATRMFQALRIWINDELGELERLLEAAPRVLSPGGRLAIISFHSLEDGRVKRAFKQKMWKPLHKKPIEPGDEEIQQNSRARSAKLRVAEFLGGAP